MTEQRAPMHRTYRGIEIEEQPTASVQPDGFSLLTYLEDMTGYQEGYHLWRFEVDGITWLVYEHDGEPTVTLGRPGASAKVKAGSVEGAVDFAISIRA